MENYKMPLSYLLDVQGIGPVNNASIYERMLTDSPWVYMSQQRHKLNGDIFNERQRLMKGVESPKIGEGTPNQDIKEYQKKASAYFKKLYEAEMQARKNVKGE